MGDDVLFKHLNARHLDELGLNELKYSKLYSDGLIAAHRSFHRRCHDIATPGYHDHVHIGEN